MTNETTHFDDKGRAACGRDDRTGRGSSCYRMALTGDPGNVDCGNCEKTTVYRTATAVRTKQRDVLDVAEAYDLNDRWNQYYPDGARPTGPARLFWFADAGQTNAARRRRDRR